jgi:4-hydroxy-2-oxoheptanedioate aldolase
VNDNAVKARLAAGETVAGVFCRSPEPVVAEIAALAGCDFVMCDCEHGSGSPHEFEGFARAVEIGGATPQVRVPTNDKATILRFLDAGAMGVHVPWVNTAADAEAAVDAVKYHPRGHRGLAGTRVSDYGMREPLGEYIARANRETLVVVQVETADAVAVAADIAAVPDVDVVFIGPTDLSHSLGVAGQIDHPDVVIAMDQVAEATLAAGRALGIYCGSEQMATAWVAKGARYIVSGAEQLMARALREFLAEVRR